MSENVSWSASIDPEQLYEDGTVDTDRRTYAHEDADHHEAGTAGQAIIGVTDADGRLLLVVQPEAGHAVLPHAPVEPGEGWAAAAREHVRSAAGFDVTLRDVRLVRRVDHVLEDGTPLETTHHVLFAASRADGEFEGLCETNDWELRWCKEIPVDISDDEDGVRDDIQRFLE